MWSILPYRAVVEISGKDRLSFLNGLVTQELANLSERPCYSLMLTAKGRYAWDFFLVAHQDKIWMTPGSDHLEDFLKKLSLYRLRSDVAFHVIEDYVVAAGKGCGTTFLEAEVFQDPRNNALGDIFLGPRHEIEAETSLRVYEDQRLRLNIPEGSLDLEWQKTIPLEAQMDRLNAISWTKGYYLGQELTSRTKHTGVVRKELCVFAAEGAVKVGQSVTVQGQEVGIIKSIYKDGTAGFVLLRKEHTESQLCVGKVSISIQEADSTSYI